MTWIGFVRQPLWISDPRWLDRQPFAELDYAQRI